MSNRIESMLIVLGPEPELSLFQKNAIRNGWRDPNPVMFELPAEDSSQWCEENNISLGKMEEPGVLRYYWEGRSVQDFTDISAQWPMLRFELFWQQEWEDFDPNHIIVFISGAVVAAHVTGVDMYRYRPDLKGKPEEIRKYARKPIESSDPRRSMTRWNYWEQIFNARAKVYTDWIEFRCDTVLLGPIDWKAYVDERDEIVATDKEVRQ